ncbi:MAG: hypothetical protein IJS88_01405 [Alphaproteobacteria bacterium]|nr:hypothetical protein [Alphaproteobacteria bacterium]
MNWKDKIKTFTIGALTTFLTSCGFGGENKEKDYVTSWEETPEKIVPFPKPKHLPIIKYLRIKFLTLWPEKYPRRVGKICRGEKLILLPIRR